MIYTVMEKVHRLDSYYLFDCLSVLRTSISSAIKPLWSTLEVLITMQHKKNANLSNTFPLNNPTNTRRGTTTTTRETHTDRDAERTFSRELQETLCVNNANYYLSVQILILMLWSAF